MLIQLSHPLKEKPELCAQSQGIDPAPQKPAQPSVSGDNGHIQSASLQAVVDLVNPERPIRIGKF